MWPRNDDCWLAGDYLGLWCLGRTASFKPLLCQRPQTPHRSWLCQSDQKLLDGCKWISRQFWLRLFFNYHWFVFAQYLSNVALDAGLRETANDIKKNWGEVDIWHDAISFYDGLYICRWTLTWAWEKTLLRGFLPSASWKRQSTWTWRPLGSLLACVLQWHFCLQVLEEDIGSWKEERARTCWGRAGRVQAGEEEDLWAWDRLPFLPQRGHLPHLGEGGRTCRSASGSRFHSGTKCYRRAEGNPQTPSTKVYVSHPYNIRWPASIHTTIQS